MLAKLPLLKLVRHTLLGCVLTAAASILAMAIELIVSHARESGTHSTRSALTICVAFAPVIFGGVFCEVWSRRIDKGLKANRWPEQDIRDAFRWTDTQSVRQARRFLAWLFALIGVAWAIYTFATLFTPRPNPSIAFVMFLILPFTQLSQLREKLCQALPRPNLVDQRLSQLHERLHSALPLAESADRLNPAEPLYSIHWGNDTDSSTR